MCSSTREIGSNFEYEKFIDKSNYYNKNLPWITDESEVLYLFSGRAAICLAIEDIIKNKPVQTVYFPSYFCASMLKPFLDKSINVIYYSVEYDNVNGLSYKIDTNVECDIFFAMSYFGIKSNEIDSYISAYANKGITVVEDITHRLMSNQPLSLEADYSVASLRKWFSINSGGYIRKKKGCLEGYVLHSSDHLVGLKREAMIEKADFLAGNSSYTKNEYLHKFQMFETMLNNISPYFSIDQESSTVLNLLRVDRIVAKRFKNAEYLYNNLTKLQLVKPLHNLPLSAGDCPLFFPVIVCDGLRDNLRQYLIKRNIYCPVHWPNDDDKSMIYKSELSLICDHRYDLTDMKFIISVLEEWEKRFDLGEK